VKKLLAAVALAAALLGTVTVGGKAGKALSAKTPGVAFGPAVYVDQQLAGGEPEVLADPLHGTLVYTAHEGTTHLYRNGLLGSPWGDFSFVSNYCNQVNIWVSSDGGINWFRDRFLGSPCPTSPAINTGFSDPDLTADAGGRLYNTGIDLVNDALFSSGDGGRTWDKGTVQCHDGDRPWLAGGAPNEVFMATDTVEGTLSHQTFHSTDGGASCSATGVPDAGSTPDGGSYTGFGKLSYAGGRLIEPVVYTDANGKTVAVGAGTWSPGDAAFTPHKAAATTMFAHWPALTLDAAGTAYLVWDTDARQPGTTGGCSGVASPAPNQVMLAFSKDFGQTWSAPIAVAAPSNARVFWPWVTAGDAGKVSVVWYQTEPGELADLDCQAAHVHAYESTILNATSPKRTAQTVDVVGRYVHFGSVCQGGTTCVATGQDRRLGDFFTNALDARGCVLVATGDTRLTDPTTGLDLPTARPLFVRQSAGPALRGNATCS
jgi:hypothetical protein